MNRLKSNVFTFLPAALGFLVFQADAAFALRIDLERPGPNEFVRDLAGMISSADAQRLKKYPGRFSGIRQRRFWL